MQKLAVAAKQRQVRLIDFFRGQDRLHSGKILRSMFNRVIVAAIDISSILTVPELRTIEVNYSFDSDKFYYDRFLTDLEAAIEKIGDVDTQNYKIKIII